MRAKRERDDYTGAYLRPYGVNVPTKAPLRIVLMGADGEPQAELTVAAGLRVHVDADGLHVEPLQ